LSNYCRLMPSSGKKGYPPMGIGSFMLPPFL
jgi:hypothetical protein